MASKTTSSQDFAQWIHQAIGVKNPFEQISKEKEEEMYALAYQFYQQRHYQEASHLFRLLVECSPHEGKFWKGLGASLQMQKDYEEALNCYCCCAQLSPQYQQDPYLYVQTADCYFALNQKEAGLKALEAAHTIACKMNHSSVLQHVAFMQQMWSEAPPK